jgi:hypothetical protein
MLGAADIDQIHRETMALVRAGDRLTVWTTMRLSSSEVHLGVVVSGHFAVIAIDRQEYDGLRLARALGLLDGTAADSGQAKPKSPRAVESVQEARPW